MSIYKATENIQRQATANVDTPPNEQPYNIKVSTSKITENIKWAYVGHGGNCLSPEGGVPQYCILFLFSFIILSLLLQFSDKKMAHCLSLSFSL